MQSTNPEIVYCPKDTNNIKQQADAKEADVAAINEKGNTKKDEESKYFEKTTAVGNVKKVITKLNNINPEKLSFMFSDKIRSCLCYVSAIDIVLPQNFMLLQESSKQVLALKFNYKRQL